MKTLVVEDDFTSRVLLQELLAGYGPVHIAVNGKEAVEAVQTAVNMGAPYQLICLDIMMPEMDGYETLARIRNLEAEQGTRPPDGAKVLMTTGLQDMKNVIQAFRGSCDAYLLKPIDKRKLTERLREFGLAA